MLAPTARWYVVRTQPRAEAKALLNLDRQNFPVYWPRYLRRRRHARKIDTVAAPLFPSYLFVAVDTLTQRWRSIRTDGVFTGCLGICDGMTDMERVAVLLELLGRKVRVVMDADLVAVA